MRRNSSPGTAGTPISALTRTAAGTEFQFQTAAGARYRLEGTDDLASGKWTTPLGAIEGTGRGLSAILLLPHRSPRFTHAGTSP